MSDNSYQNMLAEYYGNMSVNELEEVVRSEFSELLSLTGSDWLSELLKKAHDEKQDASATRKAMAMKFFTIINGSIAKYRENPLRSTQAEIDSTLHIIESVFLYFDEVTLMTLPENRFPPLIRFVLEQRPILLTLIATRLQTWFYNKHKELNSDFTWITLSNLDLLNDKQLRRALPVIYRLFIAPTPDNPSGFQNKNYSQATKDNLKYNIAQWNKIVPNVWC